MAQSSSTRRPLRRFAQVGHRRRALVMEAVAYLLLARLGLLFVPFPKLARRLGHFVPPSDPRVLIARERVAQDEAAFAAEVGRAVTRSARYLPFKAVCLPQAMAAQLMLKRRGVSSALHFGAARGEDKPLDAAGVEVTGYPVANKFSEIACFV
jgi:hypothetical protein